MPTELVLLRHGESTWNKENRFTGWTDVDLSDKGREEAREAGIDEFIFVTGRGKTAIEDHFDHSYELSETLHKRSKYQELAEISSSIDRKSTRLNSSHSQQSRMPSSA